MNKREVIDSKLMVYELRVLMIYYRIKSYSIKDSFLSLLSFCIWTIKYKFQCLENPMNVSCKAFTRTVQARTLGATFTLASVISPCHEEVWGRMLLYSCSEVEGVISTCCLLDGKLSVQYIGIPLISSGLQRPTVVPIIFCAMQWEFNYFDMQIHWSSFLMTRIYSNLIYGTWIARNFLDRFRTQSWKKD